jgi:hypothetical protein
MLLPMLFLSKRFLLYRKNLAKIMNYIYIVTNKMGYRERLILLYTL